MSHRNVINPKWLAAVRKDEQNKFVELNDKFLCWVTDHVLASIALFDIALIVPLIALSMPESVKITLGVISGSWIQWWALPALQRSQNRQQALADAKADTDHQALTHIATQVDKLVELQQNINKSPK